jgi:hypothetical protein
MQYESFEIVESRGAPGVRLQIRRISFGRRLELAREIRELARKIEFLEAGADPKDQISASIAAREIEQIYLRWGLAGVEGLVLDGTAATPESLIESGPEHLVDEALSAIRAQCGLTEAERKN